MAGLYLASPRVSPRQMGMGRKWFDVGISCPCLHEVALYWDVTEYVAHSVARTENEKHIRFSFGSYRWQCCSFLDAFVEWSVGNRWITPPNTGSSPLRALRACYARGATREWKRNSLITKSPGKKLDLTGTFVLLVGLFDIPAFQFSNPYPFLFKQAYISKLLRDLHIESSNL